MWQLFTTIILKYRQTTENIYKYQISNSPKGFNQFISHYSMVPIDSTVATILL